jgi:hypothetical protein
MCMAHKALVAADLRELVHSQCFVSEGSVIESMLNFRAKPQEVVTSRGEER